MKKKILMILHLPPPVHGAAIMGKYLIESRVINQAFDVDHVNLSTSTRLNEIGKRSFRKVFSSLRIISDVTKALLRKKYDLCYVTLTSASSGFYKDLIIVLILKLFRANIVYHFHNKGVSLRQSRWIDNLLYRFAFNNTRSILLSPSLYFDFKKYVKTEHVFFCPNGIPLQEYGDSEHQLPDTFNCKLLFLSHMMVEKGVITLLDACKILKQKAHRFECHFVGAWTNITDREFTKMVKERGLEDIVHAHGPKFGSEKVRYFLESDIFVFPSHNDCFSLVLLEAMNFGLPIVATLEGGTPDIVVNEKTGFVINKKDSIELASKIEILILRPELRKEFGQQGRSRLKSHFTIDKFENNMASILESSVVYS